jgi:probable F420-dependent oxidoreductase
MHFVFHYPQRNGSDGSMLEAGRPAQVAARAEAAGFDAFALTDHPAPGARWLDAGGHQSLDPFVALGAIATSTTRIRLLTHLAVAPYRNPFMLAKAAATVDALSEGRMILGLGVGYNKTEFRALGVDMDERNELFDEALEVLPLHWAGEPFSYTGRHFEARHVVALPRPVQQPIPIWIGGNSTLSRRRAAERGQGWMPMLGPPQLSATARTRHIESEAELADLIAETQEWARAAGRQPIDILSHYAAPTLATTSLDADRHREAFAGLEAAGVNWLIVGGGDTRTPESTYRFLDDFGDTYIT